MDELRCGLIGASGHGRRHGGFMEQAGRMRLCAVCDTDPAVGPQVAEQFPGAKFWSDPESFFEEAELDLLCIALPHNLHAPYAIRALRKGWHAAVEKPMATRYADAEAMIEAAREADRTLTVCHQRRLDDWFLAARSGIEQGLLGRVFRIDVRMGGTRTPRTWRGRKEESGGVMFDWGSHMVDWALLLGDSEVESVSGFFLDVDGRAELNQDHGELRIRFCNGAVADVTVSRMDHLGSAWRYRILGQKGALLDSWGGDGRLKVVTRGEDGRPVEMFLHYEQEGDERFRRFYRSVAAHVLDGEPLMVTAQEGARVVAVLETAEASHARGGEPLPLPQ
jgi:predicted dehydrogenase